MIPGLVEPIEPIEPIEPNGDKRGQSFYWLARGAGSQLDHGISVPCVSPGVSQGASTLMKSTASPEQISQIIRYAWEDRTTFEQIEERTGFTEKQVIDLMARELKPSSFRLWRKRVGGRITKHRKLLERHLKGPVDEE